jgi:hypothetical protein
MHLHDLNPEGSDHDREVDVSFFELGITLAKIMPFLITLILVLLVIGRAAKSVSFPPGQFIQPHKRSRWRPPLRAPPLPV